MGTFHKKEKRNKQHFEQKAEIRLIQNVNQNVDESINTPKLDSHYYFFILFITLHSFDAVLCLMIMLVYTWKHLLFRFLLHLCFLEIMYRRCVLAAPTITMKTRILGAQVRIFRLFLSRTQVYLNVILSMFLRSTYSPFLRSI